MIEVIIDGYFPKSYCERIKARMEGKTYLRFEVTYSNYMGNCSLIVRTQNRNVTKAELKEMFVFACLCELAES